MCFVFTLPGCMASNKFVRIVIAELLSTAKLKGILWREIISFL